MTPTLLLAAVRRRPGQVLRQRRPLLPRATGAAESADPRGRTGREASSLSDASGQWPAGAPAVGGGAPDRAWFSTATSASSWTSADEETSSSDPSSARAASPA